MAIDFVFWRARASHDYALAILQFISRAFRFRSWNEFTAEARRARRNVFCFGEDSPGVWVVSLPAGEARFCLSRANFEVFALRKDCRFALERRGQHRKEKMKSKESTAEDLAGRATGAKDPIDDAIKETAVMMEILKLLKPLSLRDRRRVVRSAAAFYEIDVESMERPL